MESRDGGGAAAADGPGRRNLRGDPGRVRREVGATFRRWKLCHLPCTPETGLKWDWTLHRAPCTLLCLAPAPL